jgi:ABC-2 type transport system permease protein
MAGVKSIYKFEMARAQRTLWQSLVAPVITTSLYFMVFGTAIGSRMSSMGGVEYGSFIVPGLIMLSVLTQSIFNASFGIYFPKFTGTIYEMLSAPISPFELTLAYVGAATTKACVLALVTLATATLFVDVHVAHPLLMLAFLVAMSAGFCMVGFVIGIWAKNFEQLQVVPLLVVTPLTFLGGVFYSVDALGEPWRTVIHFNPILYLVSGFRWTFFGSADVPLAASLMVMAGAILIPLTLIAWIFRTGYRLKN